MTRDLLAAGASAYRLGLYAKARKAWSELAEAPGPGPSDLAQGLAALATALEAAARSDWPTAETEVEVARRALDRAPPVRGWNLHDLRSALEASPRDLAEAPPSLPSRGLGPAALRFSGIVVLLGLGFLLMRYTPIARYLDREILVAELGRLRGQWWAPFAHVGVYVVACPLGLPVTPLIFAGGVVFGSVAGVVYNTIGTFAGAAVTYGIARALGRELVLQLGGPRLREIERHLARQGFWTLVRLRWFPIPFPIFNYGAALAGIPAGLFLGSSAVGLLPAMLIYTHLAASLYYATGQSRGPAIVQAIAAIALLVLFSFLPTAIQRWRGQSILPTETAPPEKPTSGRK